MSVQYWDEYTLTKIISEQNKQSEDLPLTFLPDPSNATLLDTYIGDN